LRKDSIQKAKKAMEPCQKISDLSQVSFIKLSLRAMRKPSSDYEEPPVTPTKHDDNFDDQYQSVIREEHSPFGSIIKLRPVSLMYME
jgi:hypothetical protein